LNKFVVADTHLDDEAILKHCRHQFCVENKAYNPEKPFEFHRNNPLMVTPEAMEAHNSLIKTNWNRRVGKKHKIVILGDFAFRNHAKHLSELNGHKILVRGTHDSDMPPEALAMFDEIHEWIMVVGAYAPRKLGGRMVYDEATVMCHYPMRSWPGSCVGSCHLYGHSHGALQEPDRLMAFDVGVDVWGYIPVTWDAISEKFRLKLEAMGDKGYPGDIDQNYYPEC
jgi:calcineurin-like phosphoesterase family protein